MKNIKAKVILSLVVFFLFLTGCTGTELSDNFDQEQVIKQAKDTITLINNEDSEALLEMSTAEMQAGLTEETLNQIYTAIDEAGAFQEFADTSVAGDIDKAIEEEYAVTVVETNYENESLVYTLTFNEDMELAGLFYK